VWAARRFFHLPYFLADIQSARRTDELCFSSRRVGEKPAPLFSARYRPSSDVFEARAGTLESFLAERYCLYAQAPRGSLFRADVHHMPWPLQEAVGDVEATELVTPHGITLAGKPVLHFSRGVDVVIWPMVPLVEPSVQPTRDTVSRRG